ncbi:MAG: type II toxin-antitoxin system HicB family antitoxin [Nitrospinales bacterium]
MPKKKAIQFTLEISVSYKLKKKKDGYVSTCPDLDVITQGNNEKEAVKNLREAVTLFFISCFERGTLDKVLKDCGFEPIAKTSIQKRRKTRPIKKMHISVPFQIRQTAA